MPAAVRVRARVVALQVRVGRHGTAVCRVGVAPVGVASVGVAARPIRCPTVTTVATTRVVRACGWCGRPLPEDTSTGRRRRYCGQSCRQRAYEQRVGVQRFGLASDAVILTGAEFSDLQDRLFRLRCAAEDLAGAARDDEDTAALCPLAAEVTQAATDLERLR